MRDSLPRLHVVTADHVTELPDLAARARAIGDGGLPALHARARLDGRRFVAFAETLRRSGAPLFVNDRADVARALEAQGLHLPADSLPTDAARRLMGNAWVGRSAHSSAEARAGAADGADYVMLGPIWATASHPDRVPLGLQVIVEAAPAKVIAIGGVTPERVAECRAAGAYGVAVLSAAWEAEDAGSVVRRMMVDLE